MRHTSALEKSPSQADAVLDSLFSIATREFLDSAVTREEGAFLRKLSSQPDVKNTIEIGCANGVSGIYICFGLSGKENVSHTAIDPFQFSEYQGRGVENIRRSGFDCLQLIAQPSELALPDFLNRGASFDMALIDGLHTADQTLVDFYYLDRIIRVGGVIVFDDVHLPAVARIAGYVATYPNYKVIGTCGRRGARRRLMNALKRVASLALRPLQKLCGEALCREFFDISLLHPHRLRTIESCTMIAFRKTAGFKRGTTWHRGM